MKHKIRILSEKVKSLKETINTEESTKTAFILPLLQILGYDIFNPLELIPECHSDIGGKKGEKVEHIYEVTNTGTNPLIISNVKPGCGCTVPDYTKEPILPGKKGKITLHFDSTNFDGAVNKATDVFVNVEKAPVRLTFSANILP